MFPCDSEMPGVEVAPQLPGLLETHGIRMVHVVSRSRMADAAGTPSLAFPGKRLLAALADHADSPRLLAWVDLPSLAPPWPLLRGKRFRVYFPRPQSEDESELAPWLDPTQGAVDPAEDMAWERLQGTYAAMLTYFDAQLGKLLRVLRACNWYDDVLLIVTSDRGLGLAEHGCVGTATMALHEEFIHIPLLMRLPGSAEAGRRVSALSQTVDLFATLFEVFGLPSVEAHGYSLLPLARGKSDSIREYACAGQASQDGTAYTLRTPEWSFLLPAQRTAYPPQLYVQRDDRWEVNNVLQHHPELAQRLEKTLRDFVAVTHEPGPFQQPTLTEENHETPKDENPK